MAKIIVLTVEEVNETPQVGITCSDGVSPQQALVVCQAAANHFQEQCMTAEIEKRVQAATQVVQPSTPASDDTEETP